MLTLGGSSRFVSLSSEATLRFLRLCGDFGLGEGVGVEDAL
jgi:hypothetical protein